MKYRIIDADAHVNEPGDVWVDRVPASMRSKVPQWVDLPGGRVAWSYMDGQRLRPIGLETAAGLQVNEYDPAGVPKEKIRKGNYEPHERLKDMDIDMVQAQVIYPGVALTGAHSFSDDRDLQIACVRAYNDWLHEFSSVAPDRLIGLPIMPCTGVEDLILEWKRVAARGARGVIISSYPNGTNEPNPADDRFWSEVQEWPYAVHIHFGFFDNIRRTAARLPGTKGVHPTVPCLNRLGVGVFKPLADMIHDALFEQYPKLKVVAVETGIGWVPYFLETIDDNFLRHRFQSGKHLKRMPSEYFREQVWCTFVTDPLGVELRHRYNVERIMWSTDYPHVQTDWPNSQRVVAYEFRQVPADERHKMLCTNAGKLYGLNAG